jgi:hypothetical protein
MGETREGNWGGEHDQRTFYTCMKMFIGTHHFIQLINANNEIFKKKHNKLPKAD